MQQWCKTTVYSLFLDISPNTNEYEVAKFIEKKTLNSIKKYLYKEGHVYYGRKCRNKSFWECKEYYNRDGKKCLAKATTKGNRVLAWRGKHNHDVIEPSNKT